MNFVPGKSKGGGLIELDHGGNARSSQVAPEAGRAVSVGIRPEHLAPCSETEAMVKGPVELVEQLGADALVHIGHGPTSVIARVPHGTAPAAGSVFCVRADPARVFVFDAASGARV